LEANKILATAVEKETELFEKISQLGFKKVKEVAEKSDLIEKSIKARSQAEIINSYALKYPHKKFISTEAMDEICEKYNLVLGPDQHYTGSMPNRSMLEIIDFKLNPVDETYHRATLRITKAGVDENEGVLDWTEIEKTDYMKETSGGTVLVFNEGKRNQKHYISNKDYFYIAAPESMFEMDGLVKEGNQLKQVFKVDDPICLKPVKFGYIVVAVWGEEMAIERMQNEKLN
jgi:hypothetical protein